MLVSLNNLSDTKLDTPNENFQKKKGSDKKKAMAMFCVLKKLLPFTFILLF